MTSGKPAPAVVRPCSKCGEPKDGRSGSGMCKKCERDYRYQLRHGGRPKVRTPTVTDRQETPAPALPVPPPRFVPVIRHEPMRRSTRRERMEEIRPEWRRFLHPFNVPDDDLTPEELRARRAKEGRR